MNSPRRAEGSSDVTLGVGALLAVCVFLTRLPFVWSGFGTDTDTWKFACAVREIADTGRYTASRFPGYPLMKWLCTPLARVGPWAPNARSAVAAAACAWLTARRFARAGVRDAWLVLRSAGAEGGPRGPVVRDLAKRQRMEEVAQALVAWWPPRPAQFRIAAGNMIAMMYYLFPESPLIAPFTRTAPAAERAEPTARGGPLYSLPDVARRMRISEGLTSAAGFLPLAGAEPQR